MAKAKGKKEDPKATSKKNPKTMLPGQKGAKAKKKKWSTVKIKEKLNNAVVVDQKLYDRIIKDAPKMTMITVAIMSDKFKINGAVARRAIRELMSKSLLK
jgi:small subunit ribosomal protein S25e